MKRKKKFFKGIEFFPFAHRGASREFPENTIEAFKRAHEILPQLLLELDVRASRDGAIAIFHNDILEITTNGTGPLRDYLLSDLKKLDAGYNITFDQGKTYPFRGKGYRIALLSEVLVEFPAARFSIDIKDNDLDFSKRVISLVAEHDSESRVIIGSFHNRIMRYVRKKKPAMATSYSMGRIILFLILNKIRVLSLIPIAAKWIFPDDALVVPEFSRHDMHEYLGNGVKQGIRIITPRFIKEAHKRGIPVIAWTINREENMRRLISWGIDGIISDFPDRLKRMMHENGLL